MKEYIHVNVRWRMHGLAVAYVSEHREIIDQYAAQGYRFVAAIPKKMVKKVMERIQSAVAHM